MKTVCAELWKRFHLENLGIINTHSLAQIVQLSFFLKSYNSMIILCITDDGIGNEWYSLNTHYGQRGISAFL